MASPPIPPLQDHLANRPFSLYPPILNIRHNEWIFRKATWSEILVVNRSSGREIRIARCYVGEVSRIEEPVLIVGLCRELEYRDGMVVPAERRVIAMPVAVGEPGARRPRPVQPIVPAPIVGIRLERRNHRPLKLLVIALAALLALALAGIA